MKKTDKNLSLFPDFKTENSPDPLLYESIALKEGYKFIAGVDEVGRGPLAGPVVAGAVILPVNLVLPGVKDSKKMTEKARIKAFSEINRVALSVGIGVVPHSYIDDFNILKASLKAMKIAVGNLEKTPDFLLVDGIFEIPVSLPQRCIKKGDQRSMSISAASIIAKVYRDRIMCSYHEFYPEYGFDKNKGYGTAGHIKELKKYGPCPVHRLSFKGVQ